ncbi:LOW QUALITY PROTEIN: POLR-like protein, partial [Mya arenaria]
GDLNEALDHSVGGKRRDYLCDFLEELDLKWQTTGKTYISPSGKDCSGIDYFLMNITDSLLVQRKNILQDICNNTSDHYPISCEIQWTKPAHRKETVKKPEINWNRVDTDLYAAFIDSGLDHVNLTPVEDLGVDNTLKTLCHLMEDSATKSSKPIRPVKAKPKLRIWNSEIKLSLESMKLHYKNWKKVGKPTEEDNPLLIKRQESKKKFRSVYRQNLANKDRMEKQKILEARQSDSKLFHRLVSAQRKKGSVFINDLHVGERRFPEENILEGFKQHFESLAQESSNDLYDDQYHSLVKEDALAMSELASSKEVISVTREEVLQAIGSINTGKSPDIYNITKEHILKSGNAETSKLINVILYIVNCIIRTGKYPNTLKSGLLTPIFKNKGLANISSNYRGITVLPVLGKVVEAVLRARIAPRIEARQNIVQRSFTRNASPLNSAFIVEELYRETKDNKETLHLILLDAKVAFDVVDHKHLLRRLYQMGIDDKHWSLIESFHQNGSAVVKWKDQFSEKFQINQGVRQGGILSTDLYKAYVNPLLDRLQGTHHGHSIGNIRCAASACADDVCLAARTPDRAQLLLDISTDFANMERYILQPTKSVHIPVTNGKKSDEQKYTINNRDIPTVKKATHLGIIRTESLASNQNENIEENLRKTRRASYSLFGSGLRGHDGLNIRTLPSAGQTDKLEVFQKKFLKQLLQLPNNTANPAVYLITGLLPVEAQIHIRTLTFLYNLAAQDPCSIERQLLERQYAMKTVDSSSWVICVQKILWKYDLPSLGEFLEQHTTKASWKTQVYTVINKYWGEKISHSLKLYKSLQYLADDSYIPGNVHPLFRIDYTARESERLKPKLKLATGTYILQTNRKSFNQHGVPDTCTLCNSEAETAEHFVLTCPVLEGVRRLILSDIISELDQTFNIDFAAQSNALKIQYILNCWPLVGTRRLNPEELRPYETQCCRLLYNLDLVRIRTIGASQPRRRKPKATLRQGLPAPHKPVS